MEGVTRTRVIDGTHVQHLKEMHTFADNAPCMEVIAGKGKIPNGFSSSTVPVPVHQDSEMS
jgi:hypothetical protein